MIISIIIQEVAWHSIDGWVVLGSTLETKMSQKGEQTWDPNQDPVSCPACPVVKIERRLARSKKGIDGEFGGKYLQSFRSNLVVPMFYSTGIPCTSCRGRAMYSRMFAW